METPYGERTYPNEGAPFYNDAFGERISQFYTLEEDDILGEALMPLETPEDAELVEEAYIDRFEQSFGEIIGDNYPQEVLDEIEGIDRSVK